jgi:hypothetical protein
MYFFAGATTNKGTRPFIVHPNWICRNHNVQTSKMLSIRIDCCGGFIDAAHATWYQSDKSFCARISLYRRCAAACHQPSMSNRMIEKFRYLPVSLRGRRREQKGVPAMPVRTMTACALVLSLTWLLGCPQSPTRISPPSIDALAAGTKAIEMHDTDKNGAVSGAELDKCPAWMRQFSRNPCGDGGNEPAKRMGRASFLSVVQM